MQQRNAKLNEKNYATLQQKLKIHAVQHIKGAMPAVMDKLRKNAF